MDLESLTRSTLLLRVRDLSDQAAWDEFVGNYAPKVFAWCHRFGLQDSDAADVTQSVLLKLVRGMQDFEYDRRKGSFRGWLKTIAANAVRDLHRSAAQDQSRPASPEVIAQLQAMQSTEAIDRLSEQLEDAHRRELFSLAQQQVQLRVQPHTWEAYRLNAVEARPASEVAAELKIAVSDVYVAKSRVLKLLKETVRSLERTMEE